MTSEPMNPDIPRRKALRVAVSAICADIGFGVADEGCLETLTEMLQSCEYQAITYSCHSDVFNVIK